MTTRDIFLSLGVLLIPVLALLPMACARPYDADQKTNVLAPDYDIYATYLDDFVNKRCGTLDCHGATGRAFRHYGSLGLRRLEGKADELGVDAGRLDGGADGDAAVEVRRSGVGATTPEEVRANYAGIIALEPEVLSRIVALNGNDINTRALDWMFLRKGLGLSDSSVTGKGERHKGGNVLRENDPGYRCIVLWLRAPRRPGTWRVADDDGGTGMRAKPNTPEEIDYASYLDRFDAECKADLQSFR